MKQQQHSAPQRPERRAFTIRTFCETFELSRATANRLINTGELRRIKAGRRTLVATDSPWIVRACAA